MAAQASAVANGGGYLLDQERDQEVAYDEERCRRFDPSPFISLSFLFLPAWNQ